MVQRTCKVCQLPFDFRGGSPMCSNTCRDRWEQLRANVYRAIVVPARKDFDTAVKEFDKDPESYNMSKREFKVQLTARLNEARELHSRFLESSHPIEFVQNELSEHADEILGEPQ